MKRNALTIALLSAAALFAADVQPAAPIDATAAFSRLKSLAGEWQADTPYGKSRLDYELIAGGTTLIEHESMGAAHAMLTAYHMDGRRLLLTHYCMAGNQPRMQAESYDPASGTLRFQFLDATNLTSPDAGHMHDVTLRLVDSDHLVSEWQFYEGGRLKRTESFAYTRVR